MMTLERLALHPQTWPILLELTGGKPRLGGGNMMVDVHDKPFHPLHSGYESTRRKGQPGWRRSFVKDGKILTLRYMQQHESVRGGLDRFSPEVKARLSPETLELAAPASFNHTKEIVKREGVALS